ncbi:hypothetical protein HY489_05930 [Candidatus Woesearchaeota archaeon]|nr:hypothetical protein [Candidatus Woesearchaeota archaeon]
MNIEQTIETMRSQLRQLNSVNKGMPRYISRALQYEQKQLGRKLDYTKRQAAYN